MWFGSKLTSEQHYKAKNAACEIWGSQGGKDDDVLLGFDTV
jgi:hypothetical protein